ncbi:hypothetical protein HanIR_Chr12g0563671 [Helianthus annuus]|nr:hypothetical protein HanIR_Chr12g0563671 [Helianthus annuus]
MFDNNYHHIHCSTSEVAYRDCWSLPVVTLTTVAIALPNIEKVAVEKLMKGVREGLEYVTLVEEKLNAPEDYVSIQMAAETLWQEVDVCHTWLGIELRDIASQVNTTYCQVDTTRQVFSCSLKSNKEDQRQPRGGKEG